MHGAEIEQHDIARLHLPFHHPHRRVAVGIGHRQIVAGIGIEMGVVDPAHRQYGFCPQMRAGHQAERRLLDRIDRDPETDRLAALDEIIGAVLMPGRRLGRARFLDQHMVVEELRRGRPHRGGGGLGDRRVLDHSAEFGNALPIAVIVEEAARLARPGAFHREGAGFAHIALDTSLDHTDPVRAQAAQDDGAIAPESFHLVGGHRVFSLTKSTKARNAPGIRRRSG